MEKDGFLLGIEDDLAVVEEIDLENFIAHSKHDGMPCFQPLLHVNKLFVFEID